LYREFGKKILGIPIKVGSQKEEHHNLRGISVTHTRRIAGAGKRRLRDITSHQEGIEQVGNCLVNNVPLRRNLPSTIAVDYYPRCNTATWVSFSSVELRKNYKNYQKQGNIV